MRRHSVSIVETYTPSTGALSEQFSRTNGAPLSAIDLTWSVSLLFIVLCQPAHL